MHYILRNETCTLEGEGEGEGEREREGKRGRDGEMEIEGERERESESEEFRRCDLNAYWKRDASQSSFPSFLLFI